MQRQSKANMIGDVSDWLSYAGGALMKVAVSARSVVWLFILIKIIAKITV